MIWCSIYGCLKYAVYSCITCENPKSRRCAEHKIQEHCPKTCAQCEDNTNKKLKCSGCRQVYYCNKTCQTKHWTRHKNVCSMFNIEKLNILDCNLKLQEISYQDRYLKAIFFDYKSCKIINMLKMLQKIRDKVTFKQRIIFNYMWQKSVSKLKNNNMRVLFLNSDHDINNIRFMIFKTTCLDVD